jgi:hypothetical protein
LGGLDFAQITLQDLFGSLLQFLLLGVGTGKHQEPAHLGSVELPVANANEANLLLVGLQFGVQHFQRIMDGFFGKSNLIKQDTIFYLSQSLLFLSSLLEIHVRLDCLVKNCLNACDVHAYEPWK